MKIYKLDSASILIMLRSVIAILVITRMPVSVAEGSDASHIHYLGPSSGC